MIEIKLLIIFLVLNSIAIFGINIATDFEYLDDEHPENGVLPSSKMIAWRFRAWSLKTFGQFWTKPICMCPPCMASLHSTYFYLFFLSLIHFQLQWIVFYPMYVFILCGLNYMVSVKILK